MRRREREPFERHRRGHADPEAVVEPPERLAYRLEADHAADPLEDHLERAQDVALEDLLEEPALVELRVAALPLEDELDEALEDESDRVGQRLLADQPAIDERLREVLRLADASPCLDERTGGDLPLADQPAAEVFVLGARLGV